MTTDEIRVLDGPALTRLAFELGLTPESPDRFYPTKDAYATFMLHGQWYAWRPHADLAQADAVFRSLRLRGWHIHHYSAQEESVGQVVFVGTCEVSNLDHVKHLTFWSTAAGNDRRIERSEALALLRCACLAVASEEVPHA